MRHSRFAAVILGGLALAVPAAAVVAQVTPMRTLAQPGTVTPLGLTGRMVAFATGVSPAECRVRLWSIGKGAVTSFGLPKSPTCTIETSTGSGIASVAVATSRVVWLAYTGGNIREWSLYTARVPGAKPLRLRFAARNVDGPAPIVLGQGTPQAIPYAVNREIVLLGDDGVRLFKVVAPDAVRMIAAGAGPNGVRLVALTAADRILALTADGSPAADDIVPVGVVRSLALFAGGVAYQVGSLVHVVAPTGEELLTLPAGATMVDAAAGRILYERAGDLGAVTVATGADITLVDGTPSRPARGRLDAAGLAWSVGKTANWRPGPLPAA
jgi:hypothetical protein